MFCIDQAQLNSFQLPENPSPDLCYWGSVILLAILFCGLTVEGQSSLEVEIPVDQERRKGTA